MIRERGPWEAVSHEDWVGISSDDFMHDVILEVTGDFGGKEERLAYAQEIARRLNLYKPEVGE